MTYAEFNQSNPGSMRAIEHRYAMATRAAHFPTSEAENLMDAYEEVKENSKQKATPPQS